MSKANAAFETNVSEVTLLERTSHVLTLVQVIDEETPRKVNARRLRVSGDAVGLYPWAMRKLGTELGLLVDGEWIDQKGKATK